MNNDTITDITLTREHVKALRNADAVVFAYGPEGTLVRCIKRTDEGDGYGERDMRVELPCANAAFTVYEGNDGTSGRTTPKTCFAHINPAKFHTEWVTVVRLLKVGDTLRPRWCANNNSQVVKAHGITVDEFKLEIIRGVPGPKRVRMSFLLNVQVTEPHSLARDIRFS